jgi:tripartite-type tricarboxylate transporter receptor subunit TctC
MIVRRRLLVIALTAMAVLTASAPELLAQATPAGDFDAAAYFKGKTIRIIVGFRAGGGTDIQARHFASRWSDFLPGNPRFTVTNVTPDVASMNLLYASKPDGLTLEMTAASYVSEQFTNAQAKFDVSKIRIIGTHNGSSSVLLVRKDFPAQTVREAVGEKTAFRIGAESPDTGFAMRVAAMSQWLNIPVKFVSGLGGTAANLIALERGDVDGYLAGGGGGVWYSLPFIRPGWLKDGTVRAWAIMGPSNIKIGANAELPSPNAPYVTDLLKDPQQKELYDIFARVDAQYGKIFMAPPGTPDPVIAALRKSYEAMLADKDFRAKLEEIMGEPVVLTPGDQVETDIAQMVHDYGKNAKAFEQWISWANDRF